MLRHYRSAWCCQQGDKSPLGWLDGFSVGWAARWHARQSEGSAPWANSLMLTIAAAIAAATPTLYAAVLHLCTHARAALQSKGRTCSNNSPGADVTSLDYQGNSPCVDELERAVDEVAQVVVQLRVHLGSKVVPLERCRGFARREHVQDSHASRGSQGSKSTPPTQ
jgi:hypothetical protein